MTRDVIYAAVNAALVAVSMDGAVHTNAAEHFCWQETFDAGLQAFEKEGIQTVTSLKEQLVASNHAQTPAIEKRYNDVIGRSVIMLKSMWSRCT